MNKKEHRAEIVKLLSKGWIGWGDPALNFLSVFTDYVEKYFPEDNPYKSFILSIDKTEPRAQTIGGFRYELGSHCLVFKDSIENRVPSFIYVWNGRSKSDAEEALDFLEMYKLPKDEVIGYFYIKLYRQPESIFLDNISVKISDFTAEADIVDNMDIKFPKEGSTVYSIGKDEEVPTGIISHLLLEKLQELYPEYPFPNSVEALRSGINVPKQYWIKTNDVSLFRIVVDLTTTKIDFRMGE